MNITWHPDAWEQYLWWQANDRRILKRINSLIRDIQRGDTEGIGKPEILRGDLAGWMSRRITDEHRLIYRVTDDEKAVLIAACRYHYER